jgi:hypothetical protein
MDPYVWGQQCIEPVMEPPLVRLFVSLELDNLQQDRSSNNWGSREAK